MSRRGLHRADFVFKTQHLTTEVLSPGTMEVLRGDRAESRKAASALSLSPTFRPISSL